MGTLVLGCAFALVVATAALAASCLRLRSPVGFLLAVYVLATTEIVVASLALSTVRGLTRTAVLVSVVVAFVLMLAVWLARGRPRPRLALLAHALRDALRDSVAKDIAPRDDGRRRLEATDWQSLSLVDDNEVEQRMHSERIGQLILNEAEWEQREVAAHVGGLFASLRIDEERSPFRPNVIGAATYKAIESVTKDAESRKLLARELVTQIDDVCAHCADGERALAHVVQFLTLPEVHRHRDDLCAVLLGKPRNCHRRVEAAGIRQYDSLHRIHCPFNITLNFFSSASAAPAPRQTSKMVSSPAIVPATSASWARSIHSANPCA